MTSFFRDLQRLRDLPIPDLGILRADRDYRTRPIDRNGAHYGEPLVPISDYEIAGANYYFRCDAPPYYRRAPGAIEELLLRRSVAERLQKANKRLRSCGLQLHVHDAFRPMAVQEYFFHCWMPERLKERFPSASPEIILSMTKQYWAQPTVSPDSPAPHNTGSAVDLTIRLIGTGEYLHMGSIFDDVTEVAHTDWFETKRPPSPDESYSDEEARQNRRLLYWLMIDEGFTNYPNEWWHYSWGDQMWASQNSQNAALFGPASFPVS